MNLKHFFATAFFCVLSLTAQAEEKSLSSTLAMPATVFTEKLESSNDFLKRYSFGINDLLIKGFEFIGVKYRWGGNTPDEGMDCSGYVRLVFSEAAGLSLPRTAKEQSNMGEKVSFNDMKPGDLVFFNTMRRAYSHVGIYIGNNQFLHSPRTGASIRIEDMSEGWVRKFNGARRLINQEI